MKAVIAVDVGGTKIAAALVVYEGSDERPRIVSARTYKTDAFQGSGHVMDVVRTAVRTVRDEAEGAGCDASLISGIGVGTAGCIDPRDGSVTSAAEGIMPGWAGTALAANLQDEFALPVRVLGDVQAHALGEARWGAAKGCSICVMVAPGTGLGGGIIVDGRVLRGAHGMAGEIGHTIHPAADGALCACGGRGHTESVASGLGIALRYQGVSLSDASFDPTLDGAEVSRRAKAGDEAARRVIVEAGFALGQAMGSWANILDPEQFILAGSVCKAGALWREALARGYASQALAPVRRVPIVDASLGSDAPLIGAAENLLDSLHARE
jgi:glucokinase